MRFQVEHCYVCRKESAKGKLVEEAGITEHSLHNAHTLIEKHGKPARIVLRWDDISWYMTEAYWTRVGTAHSFNGFGWGYGGTGPNGLASFFEMLGLDIPLSEIAGWNRELSEPKEFIVPA